MISPKSGFWLSSNPIHIRFSKYKHHIIKIAPFLDSSSKNELVLKNGQNKRQIFKKKIMGTIIYFIDDGWSASRHKNGGFAIRRWCFNGTFSWRKSIIKALGSLLKRMFVFVILLICVKFANNLKETLLMSWQRSTINEVNDWAP